MEGVTDGHNMPESVLDCLFQPGYRSLSCVTMVKHRINYLGVCITKPVANVDLSPSMYDRVKTGRRQHKSAEDQQLEDMDVEEAGSDNEKELKLFVTGNNHDRKLFSSSLELNRPMVICVDNIRATPKGFLPSPTKLTKKLVEDPKNTKEMETSNALHKDSTEFAGVYLDVDEVVDTSIGDTRVRNPDLETREEDDESDDSLPDMFAKSNLKYRSYKDRSSDTSKSAMNKHLSYGEITTTSEESEIQSCRSMDVQTLESVQRENRTTTTFKDVEVSAYKANTLNIFEQMSSLTSNSNLGVTEIHAPKYNDRQDNNNECIYTAEILRDNEIEEPNVNTTVEPDIDTLDELNNEITTSKKMPLKVYRGKKDDPVKDKSEVKSECLNTQLLNVKSKGEDSSKYLMNSNVKSMALKKLNDKNILKRMSSGKIDTCTGSHLNGHSVNAKESETDNERIVQQLGKSSSVEKNLSRSMSSDVDGSREISKKAPMKEKDNKLRRQTDRRTSVEKGQLVSDNQKVPDVSVRFESKRKWDLNDNNSQTKHDDCLPTEIKKISEKKESKLDRVNLSFEKKEINGDKIPSGKNSKVTETDKQLSLNGGGKFKTAKQTGSRCSKSDEDEPNIKSKNYSMPSGAKANRNSSRSGKSVNNTHDVERLTRSLSERDEERVVSSETDHMVTKASDRSNKNESDVSRREGKKEEMEGLFNKMDIETKHSTCNDVSPDVNDVGKSSEPTKNSYPVQVEPLTNKVRFCPCCKKALYLSVHAFDHHKVYCEKHVKQLELRKAEISENRVALSCHAQGSESDVMNESNDKVVGKENTSKTHSEVLNREPVEESEVEMNENSKTVHSKKKVKQIALKKAEMSENSMAQSDHAKGSKSDVMNESNDKVAGKENTSKTHSEGWNREPVGKSEVVMNENSKIVLKNDNKIQQNLPLDQKAQSNIPNNNEEDERLKGTSNDKKKLMLLCNVCKRTFCKTNEQLVKHMERVHNIRDVKIVMTEEKGANAHGEVNKIYGASSNVGYSKSERVRKCDICANKYFLTQECLDNHFKEFHPEKTNNENVQLKTKCTKLAEKSHTEENTKDDTKNIHLNREFTKLIDKTPRSSKPEHNTKLNAPCDGPVVLDTSSAEQESSVKGADTDDKDVPQLSDSANPEQSSTNGSPKRYTCKTCGENFRYISQLNGHIHLQHRNTFSPGDLRKNKASNNKNNSAKKISPSPKVTAKLGNNKPSNEIEVIKVSTNESVTSTMHAGNKKTRGGDDTLKRKIEETSSVTDPSRTMLLRNDTVQDKLRDNDNIPYKSREFKHQQDHEEDEPPRKRRPSKVDPHSPTGQSKLNVRSPTQQSKHDLRSLTKQSFEDSRSPTGHSKADLRSPTRKSMDDLCSPTQQSKTDLCSPTRHHYAEQDEENTKFSSGKSSDSRERSSDEQERNLSLGREFSRRERLSNEHERNLGAQYKHSHSRSANRQSFDVSRRGDESFRGNSRNLPSVIPCRTGMSGHNRGFGRGRGRGYGRGRGRGRGAYNRDYCGAKPDGYMSCRKCSGRFPNRDLLMAHINDKRHYCPISRRPY